MREREREKGQRWYNNNCTWAQNWLVIEIDQQNGVHTACNCCWLVRIKLPESFESITMFFEKSFGAFGLFYLRVCVRMCLWYKYWSENRKNVCWVKWPKQKSFNLSRSKWGERGRNNEKRKKKQTVFGIWSIWARHSILLLASFMLWFCLVLLCKMVARMEYRFRWKWNELWLWMNLSCALCLFAYWFCLYTSEWESKNEKEIQIAINHMNRVV